jgi:hypothetical protein
MSAPLRRCEGCGRRQDAKTCDRCLKRRSRAKARREAWDREGYAEPFETPATPDVRLDELRRLRGEIKSAQEAIDQRREKRCSEVVNGEPVSDTEHDAAEHDLADRQAADYRVIRAAKSRIANLIEAEGLSPPLSVAGWLAAGLGPDIDPELLDEGVLKGGTPAFLTTDAYGRPHRDHRRRVQREWRTRAAPPLEPVAPGAPMLEGLEKLTVEETLDGRPDSRASKLRNNAPELAVVEDDQRQEPNRGAAGKQQPPGRPWPPRDADHLVEELNAA